MHSRFSTILRRYLHTLAPSLGVRSLARWVGYGVLVGVVSGAGAAVFFFSLEVVKYIAFELLAGSPLAYPAGERVFASAGTYHAVPWLFFLLPAIGGLLSGIVVHRYAPEAAGVGTEALIEAFHKKQGQIRSRVPLVKGLGTLFTLGLGGASGREGPIAQIGGGFGSWLARSLHLTRKERRILLLAGAAGGFGAIFRAPLGGAVAAIEVLYREDLETDALVPCVISSVTAYALFTGIFGHDPIFALPHGLEFTRPHELLFYLVLGMLCVPVGALAVKVFWGITDFFGRIRRLPRWSLPMIGGLLVGLTGLVAPGVYGSGWGIVQKGLYGELAVGVMVILLLGKIVAMAFTLGSGGSGGVFGPTLFVGAMLGGAFGIGAHEVFGSFAPDPAAVMIVGMCAFFAGVANAPLGALLMTVEMSRSYGLVAPLMLVSVIAVLFTSRWSIFRNQVQNKFHSAAHQGDLNVNVLQGLKVEEVMRPPEEVDTIPDNATFATIRSIITNSEQVWFPVVSHEDLRLVGILSLQDARPILFEHALDALVVASDIMVPPIHVGKDENLYEALLCILDCGCGELPATRPQDGRVVGLLRHGDILRAYYRVMVRQAAENEEEEEE